MIDKTQVPYRFKPDKYYSEDYLLWLSIILPGKRAMRIELPLSYVWEDRDKVSLSKHLWKMEQGEIKSYRSIYRAGLINFPTFVSLKIFSFTKYIKRLIVKCITRGFMKWK